MRNTYALSKRLLFVVAASISMSAHAQTPTTVFSDDFNRSSFTDGSTGGTPSTTYHFTLGGSYTIGTTLVSGSNYKVAITAPAAAQRGLFYASMASFASPFSRQLNLNVGVVTWTFNMRTSAAATSSFPLTGSVAGGVDLGGNKGGNIYNGAPTGYAVVFNSGGTGGVNLIKYSAGMATGTVLISQTTTMPKTDYYSVRVTYDPSNNHWALYVRDDGASGFADPSSGVTLQQGSTITDNTYTGIVMTNFGAVYTNSAGAGKSMNVDNFKVVVTVPPCSTPAAPTGLSYSNTATSSTVTFTQPPVHPTGYILVASPGTLVGDPVAGQAITVGTAVGSNGTIVGVGTGSPITASSLTGNTGYTMTLFPYNNTGCTGGPTFNTAVPSNNITTCPNPPSITGVGSPTATTIPGVTWSAPPAGGGVYSTYTYLLNVYTDPALTIPASGYPLSGTTVTSPYTITGLTSGVTYYYTITAVDSACNSAPSSSANATTSVVPCSGSPTAGTAISSAAVVTGSAPFTLSLSGASGETGISFQWQSSTCENTWTNISGVTSSYFYPTSEAASTYYRCNVTCANSGLTAPSAPVYVERIATSYCNPTSVNGCSAGDGVNAFTLTGECSTAINDAGPMICGSVNTDHTSYAPVKLFAGNSYTANLNSNFDGDDVFVWIDFDNSGTFDASELIYSTGTTGAVPSQPFFYTFSLPVPSGAAIGLHRMRVVVNNAQNLVTGCDPLTFGTSVDYMCQVLPNLSLNYNSPLCLPASLTLTASPALSCGAVYTWSGPMGYSATTTNLNVVNPPIAAGTYSVSVLVNGINSCPAPSTTNVIVYSAPVITGISGMCVGSTATFTGAPTGGTWTSSNAAVASVGSGSGLVNGVSLGSANISYTIATSGCFAVKPMAITNIPVVYNVTGGGNYCAGGTGVHIGLSNSGVGVSYQLYNGVTPVGSPVTGTGTTLDFGLITSAGTYTVVANPGSSCATNMNGSATVVVNPLPANYSLTGGGSYCPGGNGVLVGLAGSDPGVTYQLSQASTLIGSPRTGDGSPIDFGLQTALGSYNVFAQDATTGCSQYMSPSVMVSLKPTPVLYAVTGGGSYCAGGTGADVSLGNSSVGTSYQLYYGLTAVGAPVEGTGNAIDFGPQTGAGIYTVVAIDDTTTCTANMIGSAAVAINSLPSSFNVTGGGSYCAGGTGVHVGLNGSEWGVTYMLYNGGAIVSGASGTTASLDFGLEAGAGSYTVVGTNTVTGCVGNMSGSVTVNINPLPTVYVVTGGGSYCAGGAGVDISLSGSDAGTNYTLLNGGVPAGSPMAGSGLSLDFGTIATSGNYTIVATDAVTGCNNNMGGTTISVNPLPTPHAMTGGGSFCAGASGVSIGLDGSDLASSYQLMNGATPVGSAVSGTGSILDFGLQSATGTYTVMATNAAGCTGLMSGTSTVAVNPAPNMYTVGGGGSYCFGGSGIDVNLSASDAGNSYQLYNGSTPAGSAMAGTGSPIDFGLQTVAGTYTIVATTLSSGCAANMNGSAAIAVTPVPTVFNVTGGGNYCVGGAGVHVGLDNSTAGVNYQLYNGGTSIGTGVTGTGLPIDFGAQTAGGTYTIIASSGIGCNAVMAGSAMVAVTVSVLPAVYTVTGGGSYCAGSGGVHTGLAASAPGISYQLYNGVAGMGAAIIGTGSPLDFGVQTITGTYTVVATDLTNGCASNMTGSASISVKPLPVVHTVTGGGNYCIGGTGVNIGLNGTDAGISYQLYLGTAAVGGPAAGTGSAINFGLQTTTGNYTVQATDNTTGCMSNMTGSATVTVSATPMVYSLTGGGSYCATGAGVMVGLGGSDPGISYQLYNGSAVGTPVVGTGSAISFGLQTVVGSYTVIATGSPLSCVANMSGSASVNVNLLPADHTVTGGGSYCAGGAGVPVGLNTGDAGINYQLYLGTTPIGAPVTGTGSALSFGLHSVAGTYTVKATDATSGCTNIMIGSAAVAMNPLPASYSVTGGGGYCTGAGGAGVHLSGSQAGISYQLYSGSTVAGSAVAGSGSALDFGLQPAGVYTVMATNPGTFCSSNMTGHATVSVNPVPVSFSVTGGGAYCAGGSGVNVQLNGSVTGVKYQLYYGSALSGLPVTGNGSAINFGLKTASGTYTVIAKDTVTGCTGAMGGSATVTANPLPATYAVTGSSPSYCAGGAGVTISLTGSDAGVNYQLYRGSARVGSALPGMSGMLSFGPQPIAGTYTVVAANAASGCTANMTGSASVVVNPLPAAFTVTGGGAYCTGGTGVHVSLAGSASGVHYQLYQGTATIGSTMTGAGSPLDFGLQTAAGNYTITATDPVTGCTNNMTGSAIVGVNPLPAVQTVTGGGSYCAGGAGVNVGLGGSAAGVSYQLYRSGSAIGSVIAGSGAAISFGHQTTGGTYTVVAVNPVTGCSSNMTGSALVAVNPVPVAYAVTGGGGYCTGGSGVHVGLGNSNTGVSYQLFNGTSTVGGVVTGTGAALDFGVLAATGVYTVQATDIITECQSNMAGSATVNINALPAAYAVTGGGSYCAGGSGVHVGLGSSAAGVDYTLYSGSAITTVHGTGSALDFGLQTAIGAYTVRAVNAATSCANNMTGSATISTVPAVTPSVTVTSPSGSTACNGHMSTFTAVPANGGSSPVYQWTINGVPVGSGANTYSYIPLNGDIVAVKMTSNATCASPAVTSASLTMSVNTSEAPSVLISSDRGSNVCDGSLITFTAVPAYGGSAPTYTWYINGAVSPLGTYYSLSYVPANGDNVYCVLGSNYNCRLADSGVSNTVHITTQSSVTPIVVISVRDSGGVAPGAQQVLTATVTNGGPSPSYQWYVNGVAVPGATLPVFESKTLNDQDVVTCEATSDGPCAGVPGSASVTVRVWNVGVTQLSSSAGRLNVVPNPNNGAFSVVGSLESSLDEELTIEISDMLGHIVYSKAANAKGGKVNERIQLDRTLANGMYLLTVRSQATSLVFHVVVEQ